MDELGGVDVRWRRQREAQQFYAADALFAAPLQQHLYQSRLGKGRGDAVYGNAVASVPDTSSCTALECHQKPDADPTGWNSGSVGGVVCSVIDDYARLRSSFRSR